MARLVIAGCLKGKEVTFEEDEIREIISLCDPYDKVAVAEEIIRRFSKKRPEDKLCLRVISLNPFRCEARIGGSQDEGFVCGGGI